MILSLAIIAAVLALMPAVMFLRNLRLYAPLPRAAEPAARCSVLIPARNEEANIAAALNSILLSKGVDFEVVVLDDGSTDRTAEIVQRIAADDSRVRLAEAQPLPEGWCGKNFACHQLAALARHPLLVFMDADVRIARLDSLARLAEFVAQSGAALASGVPCQHTGTLMERLVIPLIHFVLLGFLPVARMRKSTDPRFAAACGQILAVRRDAYDSTGGHAAVANRIHDAVALARSFRAQGLATDLFDATDTFHCRMYRSAAEVFRGFAKNAHEGLAAPRLIVPATLLLLGGQVLPFVALALADSTIALAVSCAAAMAALLPRIVAVFRFRQPPLAALLHPLGICALLFIQWFAFFRSLSRRPAVWKGRAYAPSHAL